MFLKSFRVGSSCRGGANFLAGLIVSLVVFAVFSTAVLASPPVRVVVAENGHTEFHRLSCPDGPGIQGDCRILMKIYCPFEGGPCIENEDTFADDHATEVAALVLQGDPDVQVISAGGSMIEAVRWAVANQERFNIRVVNRTDGTSQASGACSEDPVFQAAYSAGIAVVHSVGNNGTNGITSPLKAVIPDACGTKVIAVGLLGHGVVIPTGDPSDPILCQDDFPKKTATSYDVISIHCLSNARPGLRGVDDPFVEVFADGNSIIPPYRLGSSFSAPRISALLATYFTQFPTASLQEGHDFVEELGRTFVVRSPLAGVFDTYRRINNTEPALQELTSLGHIPTQGYYFNPERPGWGLHLSTIGSDIYLIWFTYDNAGTPIWFTAQGTVGETGQMSAVIREERKLPGQPPTFENFGNIHIDVINPSSFNFEWDYEGRYQQTTGRERVQLLLGDGSGMGGQWFDPNDPGWGLSVEASQGTSGDEFLALYYYDAQGRPVWASGQPAVGGPSASMTLNAYEGFCQGCPFFPIVPTAVGTVQHDFAATPWGVFLNGTLSIDIEGPPPWPPENQPLILNLPVVNLFP